MGKRKRAARRTHKVIGFKAFHDSDADILAWWEGIEEGERSTVIREILREYLGSGRKAQRSSASPDLNRLYDETAWIRTALTDLPGYVERVIHQVATLQISTTPTPILTASPELTQTDADRREAKLRNKQW